MRYQASISFEHDTLPAKTHRQEIVARSVGTAATLSLRVARKHFPYPPWRVRVVMLKKLKKVR